MLSAQVYDVISATRRALAAAAPGSVDDARHKLPLIQFGDEMREKSQTLKQFLLHQLYRHPQVMHTNKQAKQVVRELFCAYLACPQEMQGRFLARSEAASASPDAPRTAARVVADYIAGMTDRFAGREHERLTGQQLLS
jgi:dGTPase